MAQWTGSLKQTASNNAAAVVAGLVTAGVIADLDGAKEAYTEFRDFALEGLDVADDNDDKVDDEEPQKSRSGGSRSSSRSSRARSGGSGSSITVEDAENMMLNFGMFEGVSLGELVELSAAKAERAYKYRNGSGADYVAWLAGDNNKNDYVRRRARLICEDRNIEFEED